MASRRSHNARLLPHVSRLEHRRLLYPNLRAAVETQRILPSSQHFSLSFPFAVIKTSSSRFRQTSPTKPHDGSEREEDESHYKLDTCPATPVDNRRTGEEFHGESHYKLDTRPTPVDNRRAGEEFHGESDEKLAGSGRSAVQGGEDRGDLPPRRRRG